MSTLSYLSIPYSAPDPNLVAARVLQARIAAGRLMTGGRLVMCPVAMNHETLAGLAGRGDLVPRGYWRELEARLAFACDELVVLTLAGWKRSRGVARELALFLDAGKPVLRMTGPNAEPFPFPAEPASGLDGALL